MPWLKSLIQTTFITCCVLFWIASRRELQDWNVIKSGGEANSHRREQERQGYTALETSKTVKLELLR